MNDEFAWGGNSQDHHDPDRRAKLERDVQNLVGPIANIAEMSDADLYGLRDEIRSEQRRVGQSMKDVGDA